MSLPHRSSFLPLVVVQSVSTSAESFLRSLPCAKRPTSFSDGSYEEIPPEEVTWSLDELMDAIQSDEAMTDNDRMTGYKTIMSLTQKYCNHPFPQSQELYIR